MNCSLVQAAGDGRFQAAAGDGGGAFGKNRIQHLLEKGFLRQRIHRQSRFWLGDRNVVVPGMRKTKQPQGCFVSVWRKADYLLAISTVVPAFAGPWASSRSFLCLVGDKAIPSLPAVPQISARMYWLP